MSSDRIGSKTVAQGNSQRVLARLRQAGLIVPMLAMVPALALLIGLGAWQWQRLAWKEQIIATIGARSAAAPMDLAGLMRLDCNPLGDVVAACDYVPVRLVGRFDHSAERHVFIQVPMQANGVGGPGYWVFTPLRLGDGTAFYVNRGFVPEAKKAAALRSLGQIEGETTVVGLLRAAERRGRFSAENDPRRNIYFVRDPVELGLGPLGLAGATMPERRAGSGPPERADYYIDETGAAPTGGLPLPLAGQIAIANRHLEYALTWWALAATLLAVFATFACDRLRATFRVDDR